MHEIFTGTEAKKLFEEAQQMINMICKEGCVQARGVIGLFPAYSNGDDMKVLNEDRSDVIATLYGLRQQVPMYAYMYVCMRESGDSLCRDSANMPIGFNVQMAHNSKCCSSEPFRHTTI